jgi:aryl-alcohol dehydrogenase-like predicted oxidoreductase
MKRRKFVVSAALSVPAVTLFPDDLSGIGREKVPGKIEKRSLGRTGEMLSVIGFGGIVVMNATPEEAAGAVELAIASGINYFDVAPSYGDAEIKLGPALEPYREKVFLACKTGKRTKDEARRELEQSLVNLRTDHFDLYQHHAVTKPEEVDTILGPGGAMETFLEAREEGKVRFLGFSAHSVEAALAMMEGFDFDTILFPFNYATWHAGNFGPQVMVRAREKNMGILALKAMARGPWPEGADRTKYPKCWYEPLTEPEEIALGLRFTLSHPVTAAIPPGDGGLFRTALRIADKIEPLDSDEVRLVKEKALSGTPLFSYTGS